MRLLSCCIGGVYDLIQDMRISGNDLYLGIIDILHSAGVQMHVCELSGFWLCGLIWYHQLDPLLGWPVHSSSSFPHTLLESLRMWISCLFFC